MKTSSKPSLELKRKLQEFVKNRLSKHAYPREIEFVDSIPRTESGTTNR